MSVSIKSTGGRDHEQIGFWSAFRFGAILTTGEKCLKRTAGRCMQTNTEISKVVGVISRRNSTKWAGSCSAEAGLGLKMMHKVGVSLCEGQISASVDEQASWMACWFCIGLQVNTVPSFGLLYSKKKKRGQLEKAWKRFVSISSDPVTQPMREDKRNWWFSRVDWRKRLK